MLSKPLRLTTRGWATDNCSDQGWNEVYTENSVQKSFAGRKLLFRDFGTLHLTMQVDCFLISHFPCPGADSVCEKGSLRTPEIQPVDCNLTS